nr:hypothetical protein [Tanacetum cinerariifolium]
NLADKIICELDQIPNLSQQSPQNCPKCGNPISGHYCQGCAFLHKKFKENIFTSCVENGILQDSSEPSKHNTNVVNPPREPYVVKQNNGSFVDEIIFDLNKAPDLPNQFHCFHCKDALRDGEACKRCTYAKCGSGLGKGLCYICGHN